MIVRNARYKQVLPGVVGYKGNLYTKAYAKGELLFDYTDDEYETQYFTTESLEDGNVITFTIGSNVTTSDLTSISYSTDGGLTWTTTQNTASTTQTIDVNLDAGDKVLWKGIGKRLASNFVTNGYSYCSIFSSTKNYAIYGNLASLIDDTNFASITESTGNLTFSGLFYNSSKLIDCDNLVIPFTKYKYGDLTDTFRGTSIVNTPHITVNSVSGNFALMRCFLGCSNLENIENLKLLATTLGYGSVYSSMFNNCTSLITAPELPATTLGQYCYANMFQNCTSLVKAPELLAPTLVQNCYNQMFYGCTSLNYIKCLATDISATDCTQNWVYNVAPTGDFVKDPSMNDWLIDSPNGIPIGWTLHGVATYTVTLTVNDADMGVADGAGTYSAGDQVVLRADAFTGYSFVGWYDGSTLVSSDTTYVFNIYSNISYEARFAQSQQDEYLNKYFTIETLENNNRLYLNIPSSLTSQDYVSLSYSTDDGTTWTTITINNTAKNVIVDLPVIGDKVLLKGTGNRLSIGSSGCRFNCNKTYKVYGNIMSLLYSDNFTNQTTLTTSNTFSYLFSKTGQGLQYLVDASNLKLPATTLSVSCYHCMFWQCTLLTAAPELPAITLADDCYFGMFQDCPSLTTAPTLPATTLAQSCYYNMFAGCTSLTTAPTLQATTLAQGCYLGMFSDCTSLTTAPTLPATTLARSCYYKMFAGCTSLTTAPTLQATSLKSQCYQGMFQGCTSLTQAPELPALTVVGACYQGMFLGCTCLTQAPDLFATTIGSDSYKNMFKNTKIQSLKVYGVSSSYSIDFGPVNYSNGIYYTKPNATSSILDACPSGWTISKTL